MGTKLYVANLPEAPSALALRAHFSACGVVSNVELVPERYAGRGRGTAFVWMTSAADADRACSRLNGALFAGQLLVVHAAHDDRDDRRSHTRRRGEPKDDGVKTRITAQFRELSNMTYELDCSGVAVVLRVFFPSDAGHWRIVARASREAGAPNAEAAAPSRVEALRSIASACRKDTAVADWGGIDWDAVEKAMLEVRAL